MLEAFGISDPGCVRPNNEDYFISDSDSGIFILADGMGGANAGEFASRLSAETLYRYLLDHGTKNGASAPGVDSVLERGFMETNWAVRQAASTDPNLHGMGTTLLAVQEAGAGSVHISSVGDSRAYMFSGGKLALLTQDQTWVAEVGARLGLSEDLLKNHPMRHVLTMAVGSTDQLRVFSVDAEVRPGDQILLCSDGLHGVLSENILQDTLNSEKTLPDKCHYLVEAAKNNGGPDNVTVVLIQLV
ncbi:MAG TPA: protein phosphatase 2C domain-containing protein [Bryobacteraceae bacterium]|nr:protein phosphatase 2C domain-containing protein [Bryobacteraceae bacterium]